MAKNAPPASPPSAPPASSPSASSSTAAAAADLEQLARKAEQLPGAAAPGAPADPAGAPAPQLDLETAREGAELLIAGAFGTISKATGLPAYPEELRKDGAEKLAPLLIKYQVIPPWLKPWILEVKFGVWFGTAMFTTWLMVQEKKKQDVLRKAAAPAAAPGAAAAPAAA